MKKTWARFLAMVAVLGFTFALGGCGKSASADVQSPAAIVSMQSTTGVTSTRFDVSKVTNDAGGITFLFTAHSIGVAGDGYLVNNAYFLPEGQNLKLPNSDLNEILVARIFKTDRCFVVGESQFIKIGGKLGYSYVELDLQKISVVGFAGFLLPPVVVPNFKSGNMIVKTKLINPPPPQGADEFEIAYDAFSWGQPSMLPTLFDSAPLQNGRVAFKLPTDSSYIYAVARSRFIDRANNRAIVSEWSDRLEFEH